MDNKVAATTLQVNTAFDIVEIRVDDGHAIGITADTDIKTILECRILDGYVWVSIGATYQIDAVELVVHESILAVKNAVFNQTTIEVFQDQQMTICAFEVDILDVREFWSTTISVTRIIDR